MPAPHPTSYLSLIGQTIPPLGSSRARLVNMDSRMVWASMSSSSPGGPDGRVAHPAVRPNNEIEISPRKLLIGTDIPFFSCRLLACVWSSTKAPWSARGSSDRALVCPGADRGVPYLRLTKEDYNHKSIPISRGPGPEIL